MPLLPRRDAAICAIYASLRCFSSFGRRRQLVCRFAAIYALKFSLLFITPIRRRPVVVNAIGIICFSAAPICHGFPSSRALLPSYASDGGFYHVIIISLRRCRYHIICHAIICCRHITFCLEGMLPESSLLVDGIEPYVRRQ